MKDKTEQAYPGALAEGSAPSPAAPAYIAPVATAFKKLLGNGLAWLDIKEFTVEFLDIIISPLIEIKEYFKSLKYVHFPTEHIDENNIKNGEEFFNITEIQNKTLKERAAEIEGRWCALSGTQTFKQIENVLKRKGFQVRVIEDIPAGSYNKYGARNAGNGFIETTKGLIDPIKIKDGKHSFIIQAEDFLSREQIKSIIGTVAIMRPGHNGFYFIPRFFRKKEIHKKMTKRQMQTIKKYQYCDCRVPGRI